MTEHSVSGRPASAGRAAQEWAGRNWHYVLLSLWTVSWCVEKASGGGIAWDFFRSGTAALFGGPGSFHPPGGLDLYASNPSLQIGPLSFTVAEILRHLGPDNGIVTAEILLAAAGIAVIAAIENLARRVRPELSEHPRTLRLTVLVGGAAFMVAWVDLAVGYLHLDDGLALILAVAALRAVIARRPVLAGACVGLAADAKPWAVVFLAILFLLPARDFWRAAVATLAVIAAAWLPFYLADSGTMAAAHYTIRNMPTSALRALGVTADRTPSWDRSAQVLLGWVLGAVAVWRRRWAAIILLGVGARIALDPGVHGYYTAGVMVGALIWDVIGARRPWPFWSLLCIFALSAIPIMTRDPQVLGDARLAIVVTFTAALLLMPARWVWPASRHPGVSGVSGDSGPVAAAPGQGIAARLRTRDGRAGPAISPDRGSRPGRNHFDRRSAGKVK